MMKPKFWIFIDIINKNNSHGERNSFSSFKNLFSDSRETTLQPLRHMILKYTNQKDTNLFLTTSTWPKSKQLI